MTTIQLTFEITRDHSRSNRNSLTSSFDQSPPVTGCEVAMNGKTAEFAILHPPRTRPNTALLLSAMQCTILGALHCTSVHLSAVHDSAVPTQTLQCFCILLELDPTLRSDAFECTTLNPIHVITLPPLTLHCTVL